ncbi:MAG: T9SS type A sorting domain-containing protein [Ignavibacteriae bacterium]|nr:T9SS type A sorting domain-containing protein [Ignavibacteriota bacterium]
MKKLLISSALLFYLFLFCNTLISQTKFQCTVGGSGEDLSYYNIASRDGGFFLVGSTYSFGAGDYDIMVEKLDYRGILKWSKIIGGTGKDFATSVTETSDGGCAVAGYRSPIGSSLTHYFVLKLDSTGNLQWLTTFGNSSVNEEARRLIQNNNGDFIVVGASAQDLSISKISSSGVFQWGKLISTSGSEGGNGIIQTFDKGYMITGMTDNYGAGSGDIYLVKLDSNFNVSWSRTLGIGSYEIAYSVIQTSDSGYAAIGHTGDYSFLIVRLTANGSLKWSKYYGGTGSDNAYTIVQTKDGGFAAAGNTTSYSSGGDVGVIKVDSSGNLQWTKIIGGTGQESGGNINKTIDGGYAVGGGTKSFGLGSFDFFLVKLDSNFSTCGNVYNIQFSSGSYGSMTSPTSNITSTTLSIFNYPYSITTGGTVYTVCSSVGIKNLDAEIPKEFKLFQNYPNPFNPTTNIKYQIVNNGFVSIKIYDIKGNEVESLVNENETAGTYIVSLNASNYPSGVYFYKIQAGDFSETKKMILLK